MTAAKLRQRARELDTRVHYLRLTGLDDVALVAAMSDCMADVQAILDSAGPGGISGLPQRLPNLRRLVTLLTGTIAGAQPSARHGLPW